MVPQYRRLLALTLTFVAFLFYVDGYFNGIDWVNYYSVFRDSNTVTDLMLSYEPLFSLLLFILKYITNDFYYSVILVYVIGLCLLFKYSSLLSKICDVNLTILLFLIFFLNGIDLFNDQLRQFLAFVLTLNALRYLFERSKRFYIYALIATGFHYSAIIILIIYPLIIKKRRDVFFIGAIISGTLISLILSRDVLFMILSYLGQPGIYLANKLGAYFERFELKFGILIILDVLVIIWCVLRNRTNNWFESAMWNGAFLAAILHISFYFMPIFQRFNPYLNIFYCLLFSYYLRSAYVRVNTDGLISSIAVCAILISVTVGYFKDPARPMEYHTFFMDYVSGNYDIEKDKLKRCNEFITDVPFCRW